MHIGANARGLWSAAIAIAATIAGGGIRVAQAQDPAQGMELAASGPRFLAAASPRSSDGGAAPHWTDASNAAVFRKLISLELNDVSLAEALSAIAERAGLRLTYSAAVVPLDTRVTFSASNLTVGAVLSAVLYDTGVDVLLTSRGQAALVKRGALDGFQGGTVTGRVTDSLSGQGIAVATITVVGTGLSARSGDDGRYRITDVPVGEHTIRVIRIGYTAVTKPVTVLPDQEAALDFALTPQATQLEEVVAIGYGTAQRRELTGAVSSVTAEQVGSAPVTSLDEAAAGAIYGARAANGVVLITTKHGRTGQNAVSFGSYYGFQEVRRTLPVLNATQFAQMVNTAYANAGQPAFYTPAEVAAFGQGTDWQSAIFRNAPMRNYDLAISGGDASTTYYVSGSLLQNDGVVIGSDMNRGSFRLNLDRNVSRKFRIGTRLGLSRSHAHVLPNGGAASVILDALTAPPTLPVKVTGGEYFNGTDPLTGRPFTNPVATAVAITNEERDNRVIGNAFAEYDVRDGLTLRSTVGVDFLNSVQDYYSPSTVLPGLNSGGEGSRGEAETLSWTFENTIHYQRRLGTVHTLDVLGGTTMQRSTTAQIAGTSRTFLTDA